MPTNLSKEQMAALEGLYWDNADKLVEWLGPPAGYMPKTLWDMDGNMSIREGRELAVRKVLIDTWEEIAQRVILRGSCKWRSGRYVSSGGHRSGIILRKLQYETDDGPEFRKSLC